MTKATPSTIRKTPDRRPSFAKTRGRTLKLGSMATIAYLLELNETLPRHKKMTDAEIARQLQQEFPGRPGIQRIGRSRSEGGIGVGFYRALYNRGRLLSGRKYDFPAAPSFRYSEDGLPYDAHTGRPLSKSQIREVQQAHKQRRAEWETWRKERDADPTTKNRSRQGTNSRRRKSTSRTRKGRAAKPAK